MTYRKAVDRREDKQDKKYILKKPSQNIFYPVWYIYYQVPYTIPFLI